MGNAHSAGVGGWPYSHRDGLGLLAHFVEAQAFSLLLALLLN